MEKYKVKKIRNKYTISEIKNSSVRTIKKGLQFDSEAEAERKILQLMLEDLNNQESKFTGEIF